MADDELSRITGPLGLWNFPILNALIEVVRLRNDEGELPEIEVQRDGNGDIELIVPDE